MGLTGPHDSYGSWHLYICRFLFSILTFCRFTLVYEGYFVLCYKEKLEPLDRAMANFKRSQVCMISTVICLLRHRHSLSLVRCFGSFLLQDMFLSLQVYGTKYGVYCERVPYLILTTGNMFALLHFSLEKPQHYFEKAVRLSRKILMFFLYYLIELMFLELKVQVYSSFDRSGTTGFKCNSLSIFTRKSVDCVACCICHCQAQFRQDHGCHGFDPPCGSQLPVFLKYSVRLKLSAQLVIGGVKMKQLKNGRTTQTAAKS